MVGLTLASEGSGSLVKL